jgi:hypothetical protein
MSQELLSHLLGEPLGLASVECGAGVENETAKV